MALLHGLSIPLEKLGLDEAAIAAMKQALPKDAIYSGKQNYLKLTISVNDELSKYGDNVSAWIEQSKEDRDAKMDKQFVGNGKVFWTNGKATAAKDLVSDSDDAPF